MQSQSNQSSYPVHGKDLQRWAQVENKGFIKKVIKAFNQNTDLGIGLLGAPATTEQILTFIEQSKAYLDPSQLGQFLAGQNPQHQAVLQAYLANQDFTGMSFAVALRSFLNHDFTMPQDPQKIDRLMAAFAHRYHQQNLGIFEGEASAYALSFFAVMLNNDAHNAQIAQDDKMTLESFLRQGMSQSKDFSKDLLTELYNDIQAAPLSSKSTLANHQDLIEQGLSLSNDPAECLQTYVAAAQKFGVKADMDAAALKLFEVKSKSDQQKSMQKKYQPHIDQAKSFSQEPIVEKMLDLASRLEAIIKVQGVRLNMGDKRLLQQLAQEIRHNPSVKLLVQLPLQYEGLKTRHANVLQEIARLKALIPSDLQEVIRPSYQDSSLTRRRK